jgi:hypothetical protein
MHGIHESHSFSNFALPQAFLNLRRNVDKGSSLRNVKPKLLPIALHISRQTSDLALSSEVLLSIPPILDLIARII